MLTASIVLAWVQQQSLGLGWTGDDIRTIGIGVIIVLLGYLASTARDVRDDVRMLKRDLRGEGPVEGLINVVGRHGRRLDAIEDRNIAIDAVTEADRREYPYGDRRAGARRKIDIVHEVLDERARRVTDEHPTSEEE